MDKNTAIKSLFNEPAFAPYILGGRAASQNNLAECVESFITERCSLSNEQSASLSKVFKLIEVFGVMNKSQLDQSLEKAGLIKRGERGGKLSEVDFEALLK